MESPQSPISGARSSWLLAIAGLGSALVYGAIMQRLPLFATFANVRRNLNLIPAAEWSTGLAITGCVLLLFGGYALGAGVLGTFNNRVVHMSIIGFPLVFAVLLLLTFPITSTDVYDYLFRGWMLVHYHANPFIATPDSAAIDPLFAYVVWPHAVSAYGPLWEDMSWLIAWLVGELPGSGDPNALLRFLFGYKLLNMLGYGLCGAAIWAALGVAMVRWRWLGLYLWLWNPLVLWETIGAAHNDVWMALPIVLALWRLHVYRDTQRSAASVSSLLVLTAGGLIKFVAIFFGPIMLAAALKTTPGWLSRARLIVARDSADVRPALLRSEQRG